MPKEYKFSKDFSGLVENQECNKGHHVKIFVPYQIRFVSMDEINNVEIGPHNHMEGHLQSMKKRTSYRKVDGI